MSHFVLQSPTANLLVSAPHHLTAHALSFLLGFVPTGVIEARADGTPITGDVAVVMSREAFEEAVGMDLVAYVHANRVDLARAAASVLIPGLPAGHPDKLWLNMCARIADVLTELR